MGGQRFAKVGSRAQVLKVDSGLGLVFGFAVVCTEGGEPYYDKQDDHVPEQAMLEASADFMCTKRLSGDMHEAADGDVFYAFPLTAEIAKALEVETQRTGLLIGIKPSAEVFAKFEDGTYTGFSIGGGRVRDNVDGMIITYEEVA